ncbi:MAG: isopentenyl phosphate kinase [Conexivisphaerales archaeon]
MEGVVVIKLGGSVITDKKKPYSARTEVLDSISSSIAEWSGRLIVVHGGGSFGHPTAMKYKLSSTKYKRSGEGIFETREAMQQLSSMVSHYLGQHGVKTYTLPAVSLLTMEGDPRRDLAFLIKNILNSGLTPLTYGDVAVFRKGFRIVSGDYLSYVLSSAIRAERVIFTIDKQGILRNLDDPTSAIEELEFKKINQFVHASEKDATGGFKAKVSYARMIAENGIDVFFVNGFDKDALIRSLHGERGAGTLVKGKK